MRSCAPCVDAAQRLSIALDRVYGERIGHNACNREVRRMYSIGELHSHCSAEGILAEYSILRVLAVTKGHVPLSQPIAQNGGRINGTDSGACFTVP